MTTVSQMNRIMHLMLTDYDDRILVEDLADDVIHFKLDSMDSAEFVVTITKVYEEFGTKPGYMVRQICT